MRWCGSATRERSSRRWWRSVKCLGEWVTTGNVGIIEMDPIVNMYYAARD